MKLLTEDNRQYLKQLIKECLVQLIKESKKKKKEKKKKQWIQSATQKMQQKGTQGTFTKAAKKRKMSTKTFANKVLSNPDKYSQKMRKKAQFVKNVSK